MEEEYTFIVDLSSWTQQAQCRCSCTTTRLVCQSGLGRDVPQDWSLAPKWKSTAEVCTHRTFRKERAAGVVPAFTLLQKKIVKCTSLEPQTPLFRSQQDQCKLARLSFYIRALMHKLKVFSVTICAWGFSIGVALSVWSWDFLCLFSACVTAKVQTTCGSYFMCQFTTSRSSVGVTAITKSAWTADNNNKLIKKQKSLTWVT